jgi:hypothetical protein
LAAVVLAQVLNREFLLGEADAAQRGLARELSMRDRRGPRGPLDPFTEEDVREVIELLKERPAQEGLQRAAPSDDSEPTAARPQEDFAFVPRDPLLSIVQSVFEETLHEQNAAAVTEKRLLDDRRGGPEPIVTDAQLAAVPLYRAPSGRRLWGRFEVSRPKIFSDPRWVWAGVVIAWHKFKEPVAFNPKAGGPVTIANKARIVIVGDWGSGLPRARKVAERMRAEIQAGLAESRQVHAIHLGDVYYTGSEAEYRERFLGYWPVREGEEIGSFTLNGNHDMYQGGHAYFGVALADSRFARQDSSSFFALRNEHWQLLGLDTSYEDTGLYGDQAAWVLKQLEDHPSLRTVLLSHHQPFSAYEPGAKVLGKKIAPVLATKRIDAWFWGHEHRCLTYREHMDIGFSSCIGHGGIPEYLIAREGDPYPDPLDYEYRRVHGNGLEPWDTFGFAVLDLDDDRMKITFVDEDENRHHIVVLDGR